MMALPWRIQRQRGSAMMLSVMMMASLGIIVLTNLGQQLADSLALTAHEHRYLKAREQAESSLNWGLNQTWEATTSQQWLCQHTDMAFPGQQPQILRSCVRPSLREAIFLLKGEGVTGNNAPPLVVYQQARMLNSPDGSRRFTATAQGWLDFCPESDPDYCEVEAREENNAKGI
jgi:hypothetical protein